MTRIHRNGAIARAGIVLGTLLFALGACTDTEDAGPISVLQSGGHIALMRHSLAPGTGDPPEFRIGECSTQRNLSDEGRAQAVAIGEALRASGLTSVRLVSSQWCRCIDTANLLGLGDVEELPALNSLVAYPDSRDEQTEGARAWIEQQDLSVPTILVTHAINIRALTGISPAEGEIVVVERAGEGLRVVGSIPPP